MVTKTFGRTLYVYESLILMLSISLSNTLFTKKNVQIYNINVHLTAEVASLAEFDVEVKIEVKEEMEKASEKVGESL